MAFGGDQNGFDMRGDHRSTTYRKPFARTVDS
jgi:hypothetical protein